MSTSYAPPPQRPIHVPSEPLATNSTDSPASQEGELTILDLQSSVYVFPNPPSSPGGSSLFSVSSDFSGPFPGSSTAGSRGRDHSLSLSSGSASQERSPGPSAIVSEDESASWHVTRSQSTTSRSPDVDVEVWNWMVDSTEDIDEHHVLELEREVERISRWDVPTSRRLAWPARSPSPRTSATQTISNPLPARFVRTYDIRNRDHNRIRTQSNISTASTWASLATRASVQTPHPRIHIPLLSYIASLFSLDLDDPALRLLTNTTTDSVLFPGHTTLIETDDSESNSTGDDPVGGTHIEQHTFLRLFSLADETKVSLRSLREGLAVACNPSFAVPVSPFSVPSFGSIFGFYHLVGDAWSKGGRALRELRSTTEVSP